jgi:hypothetical protein
VTLRWPVWFIDGAFGFAGGGGLRWRGPPEGCARQSGPDRSRAFRYTVSPPWRRLRPTAAGGAPGHGGLRSGTSGPELIFAAADHSATARIGQVASAAPGGMPTSLPCPSWSVLLRRMRTTMPSGVFSRSSTFRPTSSERRKAPAKPRRSKGAVPFAGQGIGNPLQNFLKIRDQHRLFADGSRAEFPPQPLQELLYRPGAGRRFKSRLAVKLADSGQAPGERVPLLLPVLGQIGAI